MAIGSYADESDTRAEVAFVVREDFQGMGIASTLLAVLERIAKENQFRAFSATVLRENKAMLHVFRKRYPRARMTTGAGGDVTLIMDFDEAADADVDAPRPGPDDDLCACPPSATN